MTILLLGIIAVLGLIILGIVLCWFMDARTRKKEKIICSIMAQYLAGKAIGLNFMQIHSNIVDTHVKDRHAMGNVPEDFFRDTDLTAATIEPKILHRIILLVFEESLLIFKPSAPPISKEGMDQIRRYAEETSNIHHRMHFYLNQLFPEIEKSKDTNRDNLEKVAMGKL